MNKKGQVAFLIMILLTALIVGWYFWYGHTSKDISNVRSYTDGNITFAYIDDTLVWSIKGAQSPFNWIRFQLDTNNPPVINREPIVGIWPRGNKELLVWTKHYAWVLHYKGDPMTDWNVDIWGKQEVK